MRVNLPRALTAAAIAAVTVTLSMQPAAARSLRLRDRHVTDTQLDAGNGKAALSTLRTGFDLELSDLHASEHKSSSEVASYFQLSNATVAGHEVACINCREDLFVRWVRQSRGYREAGQKNNPHASGSKHPNAPGYNEWAKKNSAQGGSFLGISAVNDSTGFDVSDIQTTVIRDWDLEALRPKLQSLWAQRRLVVGYGMNPLHQQMDFGEALMSLARNSPLLTPPECEKGDVPHCNALFSGLRKTASLDKLNSSLGTFFR